MKRSWNHTNALGRNVWCFLLVLLVICPLYLCLMNAFKSTQSSIRSYFTIPVPPVLDNFQNVIVKKGFLRYLSNSAVVTFTASMICMVTNTFVSFMIINHWHSRFYRGLYFFLSACMFIPANVIFFPLIRQFYAWHLMNRTGLILYYAVCMIPECVFMLVPLMRTSNSHVREAAMLDGCTTMQYFLRLFVPMNLNACSTVAIISSIWIWNDFLMPLMMLNADTGSWTLPIFLYSTLGRLSASKGPAFAACLLTILPVTIVYAATNKKIIKSLV